MLYSIFLSALVILCLSMFFIPRSYKLAVMLLSLSCLTMVRVPGIPFGTCNYIIPISFLLSEVRSIVHHLEDIRPTIISKLLLLVMVALIIAYITSPHYSGSLSGAIRLIVRDLIVKYFAIAYAFVCVYEEEDLQPLLRFTFCALILLTAFGVINLIDHHSYLVDELASVSRNTTDAELLGGYYEQQDRFRVQSMFTNPFNYGYICMISLFLHTWGYLKGFESKLGFYTVVVCAVFGIWTCNCRTVFFSTMVGYLVFYLIYKEQTGRIRYALITSLGFLLLYAFVPPVQQLISYIFSMFQSNSNIAGSSLEMRMVQYMRILYYWNGHEWFGRGIDYFWIDLGWSEGKENAVDKDLFGLEGVTMNLLLERGAVGLITYITFYLALCSHIYKIRYIDQTTSAIGLAVLFAYLVFANLTGELFSVFPTLLIVGVIFSLLYQQEDEEYEEEEAAEYDADKIIAP